VIKLAVCFHLVIIIVIIIIMFVYSIDDIMYSLQNNIRHAGRHYIQNV